MTRWLDRDTERLAWYVALASLCSAAYVLGKVDERQSRPVAVCPKIEARWVGTGPRRRLDTLTTIPEDCR